jgi:hypothetical protein
VDPDAPRPGEPECWLLTHRRGGTVTRRGRRAVTGGLEASLELLLSCIEGDTLAPDGGPAWGMALLEGEVEPQLTYADGLRPVSSSCASTISLKDARLLTCASDSFSKTSRRTRATCAGAASSIAFRPSGVRVT